MRFLLLAAVLAPYGCTSSSSSPSPVPREVNLALEIVVAGLTSPVFAVAPAGDARLFIVEKAGRIRITRGDSLLAQPFLDITSRVDDSSSEEGLLGLAFHPDYAQNGLFYVNYTNSEDGTRVSRFTVSSDPDRADAGSETVLLTVGQPYENHNGGCIMFGPDRKLYIGMGDGGSGGDPHGNGQNPMTLLGALLRIDVDAGTPYGVPSDNPFVGNPDGRDEVWAIGLRNPWRFCFDPSAGRLYIADVGQNRREEVHVASASQGGLNYGWNILEGSECFNASSCDRAGLEIPVLEYGHGEGISVIGGFVYRGKGIPALQGTYVYADWTGWIQTAFVLGDSVAAETRWEPNIGRIQSFGTDSSGELYVCAASGTIYRIVAAPEEEN